MVTPSALGATSCAIGARAADIATAAARDISM